MNKIRDWKDVLAEHLEKEWEEQEDRINIIGQNGNSGLHYKNKKEKKC